jgi:hypothetical protein
MAVWNKVGSNGAAWYSLCQRKKGGSDVVGTVRVGTVKKSVQTGTEQEIGAERERVGSDGYLSLGRAEGNIDYVSCPFITITFL